MGVEFELKYRATQAVQAQILAQTAAPWQTIAMETTYYDTPQGDLSAKRCTLRRRLENGKSVCTVKTPTAGLGRGEWETECERIEAAIPELCKLGCPEDLPSLTAQGLVPVCGARFTRRAATLPIEGATVEIALDYGLLFGGGRQQPLCEVEVELKSGSPEAAARFAAALADSYGLTREPKSKFRRALDLRQGEEDGRA